MSYDIDLNTPAAQSERYLSLARSIERLKTIPEMEDSILPLLQVLESWAEAPTCEFSWNFTSNSARAWRHAGADLAEFHGRTSRECLPILTEAIGKMEADPTFYRTFDDANGWGRLKDLLPALRDLRDALHMHPDTIVWVGH